MYLSRNFHFNGDMVIKNANDCAKLNYERYTEFEYFIIAFDSL